MTYLHIADKIKYRGYSKVKWYQWIKFWKIWKQRKRYSQSINRVVNLLNQTNEVLDGAIAVDDNILPKIWRENK